MIINESTLMRYRIDYIDNKIDLNAAEYKEVISILILEIERLRSELVFTRVLLNQVNNE